MRVGVGAGARQLEVAQSRVGVGRYVVLLVAAGLLTELLVGVHVPTFLVELVAGELIGASGLHLIVPPETQAAVSGAALEVHSRDFPPPRGPWRPRGSSRCPGAARELRGREPLTARQQASPLSRLHHEIRPSRSQSLEAQWGPSPMPPNVR